MAEYTLINNAGSFTLDKQNNLIEIKTNQKYVNSNIEIETKVQKAILNGTTDQTQFNIQIPNGSPSDFLILTFTTDTSGNTVVTGTNAT